VLAALLLGLLTAVSPCPLATNIAALAYVSRRVADRKHAVATAALYTLGRMVSYTLVGVLVTAVGLGIPGVASFLQDLGDKVMGPLLVAVGVFLLLADRFSWGRGAGRLTSLGGKLADWGMLGGFFLGALFALAFCPYSAVLFFGVLIPLALKSAGGVLLPAVYAVGTGVPVLVLGALLSAGVSAVSSWLNALTRAQPVVRVVTAGVIMSAGVYCMVVWILA